MSQSCLQNFELKRQVVVNMCMGTFPADASMAALLTSRIMTRVSMLHTAPWTYTLHVFKIDHLHVSIEESNMQAHPL